MVAKSFAKEKQTKSKLSMATLFRYCRLHMTKLNKILSPLITNDYVPIQNHHSLKALLESSNICY